jgi:hypothetical protein
MSLKNFVNDHRMWTSFLEWLDKEVELHHKKLEQSSDTVELHRTQGEISALRKLKLLRDKLNEKSV